MEHGKMNLLRDGVFKRNIHGYMEYTRVQLYVTHLRQIPMYVVHLVHNGQTEITEVLKHGYWFVNAENAARFVKVTVTAWVNGTDAIPSIDLTQEVIDRLHTQDVFEDKMYRVLFRDRLGELPRAAMGSMPNDPNHPWFVSSDTSHGAKYNIYPKNIALVVARLNATMSHKGYVRDRIQNSSDGAHFTVEEANYHPSGIPQDGDTWTEVDIFPVNRNVTVSFTPDMTGVDYVYVAKLSRN